MKKVRYILNISCPSYNLKEVLSKYEANDLLKLYFKRI